ncbi:MAG TPA: hypothetical protein PLK28_09815 [Candidatus Rifleibacterium sp.]|jgi:hypothetical protein|nr:hypothetical protein [Candidatus Rifleibacterium sp.]
MRNTKILIAIFAYLSCTAAFATEAKIKNYSEKPQTRISYGGPNYNDPTPNGPGDMPGDAEESGMDLSPHGGQNYSKPKPQTPASGTSSTPGTASQTQTTPAKPPKQPKPIDGQVKPSPKPPKQPQSGHSNNVGSTQNGTVTLPNGTTVYKGIKTPQDLR